MDQYPVDEAAARDGLVQAMRRMQANGMNRGTSGNASIRVRGGMIVTPSGIPASDLTAASMVFIPDDGEVPPGSLAPSSEWRMHHRILARRPEAQAVMHCHSRYATILACCGRPIEPIHYMVLVTRASRVPIAPFAPFGTESLADAVVDSMGAGFACLMAHHGQVALGGTWQQALAIAEEVEEQAAITHGAALIGGARLLSPEELEATAEQFRSYGQASARGHAP